MGEILPFDDRLTRLKSRGPTLGRLLHPVRSAAMTDSSIPFGDPDLFTPMCVYTLRCRGSVPFRFIFLLAEVFQRQILYYERRSQRERPNMNPIPTKQMPPLLRRLAVSPFSILIPFVRPGFLLPTTRVISLSLCPKSSTTRCVARLYTPYRELSNLLATLTYLRTISTCSRLNTARSKFVSYHFHNVGDSIIRLVARLFHLYKALTYVLRSRTLPSTLNSRRLHPARTVGQVILSCLFSSVRPVVSHCQPSVSHLLHV
jgi:hypothetical protein